MDRIKPERLKYRVWLSFREATVLSCTCEFSSDIYSVVLANEQGKGKNLVLESNLLSVLVRAP